MEIDQLIKDQQDNVKKANESDKKFKSKEKSSETEVKSNKIDLILITIGDNYLFKAL